MARKNEMLKRAKNLLNVESIPDGKQEMHGFKRKVKRVEEIPNTPDFLVITEEEYLSHISPQVMRNQIDIIEKGLGLLILKDDGKIMTRPFLNDYDHIQVKEELDKDELKVFPWPIHIIKIDDSRRGFREFFQNYGLKNIYPQEKNLILNLEYNIPNEKKEEGEFSPNDLKKEGEITDIIISFRDYKKNKIYLKFKVPEKYSHLAEYRTFEWLKEGQTLDLAIFDPPIKTRRWFEKEKEWKFVD